jgi:hypothetical protein
MDAGRSVPILAEVAIMSDGRIPPIIAKLSLPHEIRKVLIRHAFATGIDIETVLEAFRAVYSLGFYDGCIEGQAEACLIKIRGRDYDRK